jgi:predicted ATP-grasp superfamily ATP-dependent carboligase
MARFRDAGVSANVCESLLRPGLRQLSVGIARNSAGATVTFLAEKIRPPAQRCAGGTFVRPAEYPQAEALAARALEALDYLGLAEVEILCDPAERRLWIVEVNARPWLQCSLPLACGCDLLAHVLASRSAKHTSIDARHAWLHFWPDLQLCFSRNGGLVTLGDLTVSEYAKSLWMSDVFPVWDWSDPAPLVSAASDFTRRRFKSLLNRKRR